MSVIDNKTVFTNIEFESWADRKRLIPAERYLIQNYLNRRAKTLEAGTAGGRILFEMKALGFTSLYGFDYVPEFIERARRKDNGSIRFDVQDATCLPYENCSFDQIIYLQQIICVIEDETARLDALREAYRILRNNGTALFSFLSFDVRRKSTLYAPYLVYLNFLRKFTGSRRTVQYLPWLRLRGKFYPKSLLDTRPYVYWYRLEEINDVLEAIGFRTIAIGSTRQLREGRVCSSYALLRTEPLDGMIYVVCKK